MVLNTTADVDEIEAVLDRNGDIRPAANADEQQATNDRLGNHDSLLSFSHTPSGSTAEALPAHSVPEGVKVLVMALDDNDASKRVYVGDSDSQDIPLKPENGVALAVTDTSAIYIRAPTSGDGVAVIAEGGN